MPGIVTALKARDHIGAFAQPVNDLALALVAPLRADNHHIGHCKKSPLEGRVRITVATGRGNREFRPSRHWTGVGQAAILCAKFFPEE